jgi:hypothetical protein
MDRSALLASVHLREGLRLDPGAFVHRGERVATLGVGPIGELTILGSAEQMRELASKVLTAAEYAVALPEPAVDAPSEPVAGVAA